MSQLLDLLSRHLDSDSVQSLSRRIDATPDQTRSAIGALLPTLIAGLARNTESEAGQQNLHQALDRDHDGSILDHLGSLFGGDEVPVKPKATQGGSILDHILGRRRERVETAVSRSSGLDRGQILKLMMLLAPLIMGVLGRRKRNENLSPGGLGDLLRGERQTVEKEAPGDGGFMGRMLDQDGDGDFDMMDLMKFGAGKLFGR